MNINTESEHLVQSVEGILLSRNGTPHLDNPHEKDSKPQPTTLGRISQGAQQTPDTYIQLDSVHKVLEQQDKVKPSQSRREHKETHATVMETQYTSERYSVRLHIMKKAHVLGLSHMKKEV